MPLPTDKNTLPVLDVNEASSWVHLKAKSCKKYDEEINTVDKMPSCSNTELECKRRMKENIGLQYIFGEPSLEKTVLVTCSRLNKRSSLAPLKALVPKFRQKRGTYKWDKEKMANSSCYKTFFGENLENLDFPLSRIQQEKAILEQINSVLI